MVITADAGEEGRRRPATKTSMLGHSEAEPGLSVNPLMAAIFRSLASMIMQQPPSQTLTQPPHPQLETQALRVETPCFSVIWLAELFMHLIWQHEGLLGKTDSPSHVTRRLLLIKDITSPLFHGASKQGQVVSSCQGTCTACIFQQQHGACTED